MEKYVVSRELAEKLKVAGYPQEIGEFHWYRDDAETEFDLIPTSECPFYGLDEYFAAPLSDELLEVLPVRIDGIYDLGIWPGEGKRTLVGYAEPDADMQGDQYEDKPADALAELWLWCKENNYV